MPSLANRIARSSAPLLLAALISLPRALGEDPSSRPSASQQATSSPASTSQPSNREIALREGRRIIDESAAVYKACKTYQDDGEVVRVDDVNGEQRTSRMFFKTAFTRPGRCRFEYRDVNVGKAHFIVWADKRDIRVWRRNPLQEQKVDGIGRAFELTSWFSGGNPYEIPSLLMPDRLSLYSLSRLKNIRFAGSEKLDGTLCNIVDGEDGALISMRIWIVAETKLVRKIVENHAAPSVPAERVTTFKPKINVDIAAADLEFNAPKD